MTTLFLFAHQDDEAGVFHEIASTIARGERAVVIYLTNGAWKTVTPERRNGESLKVLQRLGVPAADIHFLGTELTIPSSALPDYFEVAWTALVARVNATEGVTRLVLHALEGGHQDHDAGHVLGVVLASRLDLLGATSQFPLYRAPGGRVLVTWAKPLAANGPVSRTPIPAAARAKYMGLLRHYSSQPTTLIKIGPLVAWDYLRDGHQKLQPVSIARLTERPNSGDMLYELWKLYDYEKFRRNADAFIAQHLK